MVRSELSVARTPAADWLIAFTVSPVATGCVNSPAMASGTRILPAAASMTASAGPESLPNSPITRYRAIKLVSDKLLP